MTQWQGAPERRSVRPEAVAAAARVVAAGGRPGRLGVVLGTGLGGLVERLENLSLIEGRAAGWLEPSTATGHAGRIACGTLGGCPLVALQGRIHAYEGFETEALTRGVELLAALGVTRVLLTNASGGLQPDMHSGELMIVNGHLQLPRRGATLPRLSPADPSPPPPAAGGDPLQGECYDPQLVTLSLAAARRAGALARVGTYACLLGPSYETRAEYRMLRRLGADAVGMSTLPEVRAARSLGLEVVAVSVVTNVARPDALEHTDAAEVCRLAATAAEGIWAIVRALAAEEFCGDFRGDTT